MRLASLLAFPFAFLFLAACDDSDSAMQESVEYADVQATSGSAAPPTARGAQGLTPPVPPPSVDRGVAQSSATRFEPGQAPPLPAVADTTPAAAIILRTGTATVEVDSLELAITRVQALARALGGYVANTSIQAGDEAVRSATLELKIPAPRFDGAVSGLQPLGALESVQISAQDVTEEFVDVSARMANAERLEDRLVELLTTRTGRLEDVLAVERELARIREEIERYQGRLRYLRTRAAISTLTVTLHEPRPVVGSYPGANPIADAFRQAWRNFVGFVAGLIAALGFLIPLGVLALLAWAILRRTLPRLRRRPHDTDEETP